MLLGCHITQHGRTSFTCYRRTNSTGDMVIAGSYICHQGPKDIKRRLVAHFPLLFHIHLHQMHRNMPRPLNHGLHTMLPRLQCQLAQSLQLGKLRLVIRIRQTSGPQTITKTVRDIMCS